MEDILLMTTMTLNEIAKNTGMSRQAIYLKTKAGEIKKLGRNQYDLESVNNLIEKQKTFKDTTAPTRTGVSKDKLETLTKLGLIKPDKHGRYSDKDIVIAKNLHISHRKNGKMILSVKHVEPFVEEDDTITLADMEKESGLNKATLLHYARTSQIEKVSRNLYNKKSFMKFMDGYKKLQRNSYTKPEIMNVLGISEEEYQWLHKNHKIEKASFDRYTKKSIRKLEGMSKEQWADAPCYEYKKIKSYCTNRDLPEDEVLTYDQVQAMLNRSKATISHLVRDGKIELVSRNRYAKESVEKYLADHPKKEKVKEVVVEEKQPRYYTAKEVKALMGIGKQTHLNYYVKKGLIHKAGQNQYDADSVDNYINQKASK